MSPYSGHIRLPLIRLWPCRGGRGVASAAEYPNRGTPNRDMRRFERARNPECEALATPSGAHFLDVHSRLIDKSSGFLWDKFTTDGSHLSAAGYAEWRAAILSDIQAHCRLR